MIERDQNTRPIRITGGWLTQAIRGGSSFFDLCSLTREQEQEIRAGKMRITGDTIEGLSLESEGS